MTVSNGKAAYMTLTITRPDRDHVRWRCCCRRQPLVAHSALKATTIVIMPAFLSRSSSPQGTARLAGHGGPPNEGAGSRGLIRKMAQGSIYLGVEQTTEQRAGGPCDPVPCTAQVERFAQGRNHGRQSAGRHLRGDVRDEPNPLTAAPRSRIQDGGITSTRQAR